MIRTRTAVRLICVVAVFFIASAIVTSFAAGAAESCGACDAPPQPTCAGDTLFVATASGVCRDGTCTYQTTRQGCSFGCENGACRTEPGAPAVPVARSEATAPQAPGATTACAGCTIGERCLHFGERYNGTYCGAFQRTYDQIAEGDACEQHYQCASNRCDGVCKPPSFWERMKQWFGMQDS
jgi:hypothetical protein